MHKGDTNQNYSEIYHFTPTGMAIIIIIKKDDIKCWQADGEIETLRHCGWDSEMVKPLWKAAW